MDSSVINDDEPANRQDHAYAWIVCLILMLCLTFSYMDRTILSLLFVPIERELHLNDTTLSLLQGTAFGLFYSLFGLPVARLTDAHHRRNLLIVGVGIWCGATAFCGLVNSAALLFLGRVCVALGEAVVMPASVSILADYFSIRRRMRALNVFTIGVYLGGGLSLFIGGLILRAVGQSGLVVPLVGHLSSWRVVMIAIGSAGLGLIPLLLCVREPKRLDERGRDAGARLSLRQVLVVFSRYRLAVFSTVFGFGLISMASQSISTWMPTLFIRSHGWSSSSIGLTLGVITLVAGPLGAITGALISERLAARGWISGKLMLGAASALGCAVFVVIITLAPDRLALAATMGLQFIVAFNFGAVQAALTEILPNRVRGLGTALYLISGNLMNALLGPVLIGLLTEHVFHDPAALPLSMRLVGPTVFVLATLVLVMGSRAYRDGVLSQRKLATVDPAWVA